MSENKVSQDQVSQDQVRQDQVIYDGLLALIKLDNNWKILNDFSNRFEITEKFVFEDLGIDVNDERQFNWFKLNHPQIFKILINKLLRQDPPPSEEKLTEVFIYLCDQTGPNPDLEVLQSLLDKGVDITTCGEKVIITYNLILFEFILKSGYKPNNNAIDRIAQFVSNNIQEFMLILCKYCDITTIPRIQEKFHCGTYSYKFSKYDSFSYKLIEEYQKLLNQPSKQNENKRMYYAVKFDTTEEPSTVFPNILKVQIDNVWYLGYVLDEFTEELEEKKTVLSQIGKPGFYML